MLDCIKALAELVEESLLWSSCGLLSSFWLLAVRMNATGGILRFCCDWKVGDSFLCIMARLPIV